MNASAANRKLILVGGGGHAKVVADAANSAGFEIFGFLDDAQDTALAATGIERLGGLDDWPTATALHALLVPAVGDNEIRQRCLETWRDAQGEDELDQLVATIIHASAFVSPSAKLAPGTFCSAMSVVNAGAVIGAACIINTGAIVEHDCIIGNAAHIAPRAALGGNVRVGNQTLVGIGAVIRPGVSIGDRCTIGAGAVVVGDVQDSQKVMGNPARVASSSEVVARHG